MAILLVIITTLFICAAFVTDQLSSFNTFFSYFSSELQFITTNLTIFILGCIVLIIYFAHSKHTHKGHPIHIRYVTAISNALKLSLLCFLLAYVLLFVIAFIQL